MSLSAKAQLLWRITGKGLTSPSYLYGTMHVTNPKAFNFSDSVLIALQQVQSFALETDHDSTLQLISGRNKTVMSDTTNYIRRYLNDKEYNYTDSLLQAKAGMSISALQLKLFPTVTGLILKDTNAPQPSPDDLFLDMWLFQKANRLGKITHHLEKLQNQIDIFYPKTLSAEDKTEFLKQIGYIDDGGASLRNVRHQQDSMMNLYYAGDLQKLGELILPTPGAEKLQLSKRNVEMTCNLVRLARQQSIFALAGAAHLPGPHGIIALLRQQGFTVTPVKATYTGITQRERQHLDTLNGYLLHKPAEGFSVIMPAYPQTDHFDENNTTLYTAGTPAGGAIVTLQDMPTPANTPEERTTAYFQQLSNRMGKPEDITPISYNGVTGFQARMDHPKGQLFLRVFFYNNKAYTFGYGGTDSLSRDQFFNSIQLFVQ
jgi:uncharacterized protein YbaP (TraB family)